MAHYRFSDDNPVGMSDTEDTKTTPEGSDGLEIALPENAETYRLLMGEDPESNPKVEAFREAYDRSMMETDDHSQCIEAGRKALEGGEKEISPTRTRKPMDMGMMKGMAGGRNPLNELGV